MNMSLYKLFSCNVEIQYKSYFLSKAMLFTLFTTLLTLILPFILAYRSRGFWLRSHNFFEQPSVQFTYEYLLVAETVSPSQSIVCGETSLLADDDKRNEESCAQLQVQEHDNDRDGKNDMLDLKLDLTIPSGSTITSITLVLALDFQLKTVCPLHMQGLAVINRDFSVPPSGLIYYGDLQFYQVAHLPCVRHSIDDKYNSSLLSQDNVDYGNVLDAILKNYFTRDAITEAKTLHSRSQNGQTGAMLIDIHLRIPEMKIHYIPSLLQEFKWAWPQYLSLVLIFYWMFNKIKKFVFSNRLFMAWEIVPWKRN